MKGSGFALEIDYVDDNSTGDAAGLRKGDRVVTVNQHVVRDPLEWRFLIADEFVEIEIIRGDERIVVDTEKEFDDGMGVHLVGPGFRKCNNRCIFCFIDQNPRGVRKPLRFKDEDYRLSFLYGNYVTFTNTPREDLERIVEQRLSPIYISVHATEPELRRRLLGNPRAPDILPIIRYLADGGIELHTQIVLMPGLNDGENLDRTVDELAGFHPGVASVGIVPVGLTRHRERLTPLRAFAPGEARDLLQWQRRQHQRFLRDLHSRFVYLSDEFYLLAGKPVPGSRFYADFPQVGNGIGMTRQFLDAFKRGLPKLRRVFSEAPQRVLAADVVTGLLPSGFVLECVRDLNASIPNLDLTPHVVLNDWYGKDITASGLLVGRDIEREFRANGLHGRSVLLPPNVLNDDELFLDDMHLHDLQTNLGVPVVVGSYDLIASVEALWWDSDKPMRKGLRSLAVLEDRGPSETMCAI